MIDTQGEGKHVDEKRLDSLLEGLVCLGLTSVALPTSKKLPSTKKKKYIHNLITHYVTILIFPVRERDHKSVLLKGLEVGCSSVVSLVPS